MRETEYWAEFIGRTNGIITIERVKIKRDNFQGIIKGTFKGFPPKWFTLNNIKDECVGPEAVEMVNGMDTKRKFFLFFQSTEGGELGIYNSPEVVAENNALKSKVQYLELKESKMKELVINLGGEEQLDEMMKRKFKSVKDIKQEGSSQDYESYNRFISPPRPMD